MKEFANSLSESKWDRCKCDAIKHRIDAQIGPRPVKDPSPCMPLHYKEDLQKKNDVFLGKEIVKPCLISCSPLAMLVPKKTRVNRLVLNFGKLNEQTIYISCPFPSIKENFHTLEGSASLTCIDMPGGFDLVAREKLRQSYTTFSTPFLSFW